MALALVLLLSLCGMGTAQAGGYTATVTTAYPALSVSVSAPQVVWAAGNGSGYPSAYISCDDCASQIPDGHPKLLHLWPVKLLQAGRD